MDMFKVLAEMLLLPDRHRDAAAWQAAGKPMGRACPPHWQPTGWSQAWGCQDKEGPTGHPKQSPTIFFNVRRAFLITATIIQRAALSQTHSDASGVSSGPKTRQPLPPLPAARLFAWCVVTLSLNLQDFPSQRSHSGCKLRRNSWDSGVFVC